LVGDKDRAPVATKNRNPVPLKETADATFPVAASVSQQVRNLFKCVQLQRHLAGR
jgi:hypothetical protein